MNTTGLTTQRLDHLGIVAGICHEINLVQQIYEGPCLNAYNAPRHARAFRVQLLRTNKVVATHRYWGVHSRET